MMLQGPRGAVPQARDPFVIVDDRLYVQAVSRQAEDALGVDERAGVNVPLEEFLISNNGDAEGLRLAQLVRDALEPDATPPPEKLELRAVQNPRAHFFARISSCGSPRAAVVILTPVSRREARSGRGTRTESNGKQPPHAGARDR